MDDNATPIIIEITRKELNALKEFLKVLKDERDSIISFSLEGIIRQNNRKEEILRKIDFLEKERDRIFVNIPDKNVLEKNDHWVVLTQETRHIMKEINVALGKNTKLLSFSMDHVKSSIENIVQFINKAGYGRRRERISLLPSREI